MILFINKNTGELFGVIEGRTHPDDVVENAWMQPSDVPTEAIVKYLVPQEQRYEQVQEPIISLELEAPGSMKVVKRITGTKIVSKPVEMVYTGILSDLAVGLENRSIEQRNVRILFEDGQIVGFTQPGINL